MSDAERGATQPSMSKNTEIVRDAEGRVVVCGHAEVVRVAQDSATFSSAVSRYPQIPNGLDGDAHAEMRRLLDPFMDQEAVERLQPQLERIATEVVEQVRQMPGAFDAVGALGARFAVRAQSAWLGWDPSWEETLLDWVADNRAASRSGDTRATSLVAERFDAIIGELLRRRRERSRDDVTTRLMESRHDDGSALADVELVSLLRNVTGGDLGSLALCAGVVVHWLAADLPRQERVARASDDDLDAAIGEVLRADDPFVSNRRRVTRETAVGGCPVRAGDVIVLDWRRANRDPRVFTDGFAPDAHAADNLVYGTGPHACPGRTLATRELRVLVRALLAAGRVRPAAEAEREQPPIAGYRTVPIEFVPVGGE